MSHFKKLQEKGPDVQKANEKILKAVDTGIIHEDNARAFAEELHEDVLGSLIHASRENSYKFGKQVMKEVILGNFYNKRAFDLSPKQTVVEIVRALREVDLNGLAKEIEDACKKVSGRSTSTSPSGAQANPKIITGLSKTPNGIEDQIGEENLSTIRKSIREGQLKVSDLRAIAGRMSRTVFGEYQEQMRKNEDPVHVFNFMMDKWYNDVLYQPEVDGYQELVKILNHEDVRLFALARRLTQPTRPAY